MRPPASNQSHIFRLSALAKISIKGGQRESQTLRQFQIGCIISGKAMPLGQLANIPHPAQAAAIVNGKRK